MTGPNAERPQRAQVGGYVLGVATYVALRSPIIPTQPSIGVVGRRGVAISGGHGVAVATIGFRLRALAPLRARSGTRVLGHPAVAGRRPEASIFAHG